MISLLVLFSLVGVALSFTHILSKPFELIIPSASAFVVVLLYVAALFGFLEPVSLLIILSGVLGLFFVLINKAIKKTLRDILTPGFIFFLVTSLGLWCFTRSDYYSNFNFVDDFSHWGRVTKLIAVNHRLPLPADGIWFQDYPPATALFNYLFMSISGFSPNDAMFAQGVLLLSVLSIGLFSFKGSRLGFSLIAFVLLAFVFFKGNGPHTLSVDLILGVFFGLAILCYLFETRAQGNAFPFLYIPIVMILPLIKQMGLFFSVVILSIIFLDILISAADAKLKKNKLLSLLLAFFLVISAHHSWSKHVDNIGAGRIFQVKFDAAVVKGALNPSLSSDRQKQTLKNFNDTVFKPDFHDKKMAYYWLFVVVGFFCIISLIESKSRNTSNTLTPLIIFILGFGAYAYLLLYIYLVAFTEYEGVRLASFGRYLGSYLVAILFVLFAYSRFLFSQQARSKIQILFFVLMTTLLVGPSIGNEIKGVGRAIRSYQPDLVKLPTSYANFVSSNVEAGAKVYLIMQGNDGTENVVFNYTMLPRKSTKDCTSIGTKSLYEGDVWTCHLTLADFSKLLTKYDYLYLAYAEQTFRDTYASVFKGSMVNGGLYKVDSSSGGVELKLVKRNPDRVHIPEHLADLGYK